MKSRCDQVAEVSSEDGASSSSAVSPKVARDWLELSAEDDGSLSKAMLTAILDALPVGVSSSRTPKAGSFAIMPPAGSFGGLPQRRRTGKATLIGEAIGRIRANA